MLIFRCENRDDVKKRFVPPPKSNIEKGDTGLYDLANPNFVLTEDQKILNFMDQEYDVQTFEITYLSHRLYC